MKEQKNNSDNSKDLWNPTSWRNFSISQQPEYSDPLQVEYITDKVRKKYLNNLDFKFIFFSFFRRN